MANDDCIFCKIVAGQLPSHLVAQTDDVLAIMDLVQARPGHVLILPRMHYRDLYDMPAQLAADVMQLGHRVAAAIRIALQPAGLSLLQSNGAAAGQEVLHMHLHLQPREPGDGLLRLYPAAQTASTAGRLTELALRIRDALPA